MQGFFQNKYIYQYKDDYKKVFNSTYQIEITNIDLNFKKLMFLIFIIFFKTPSQLVQK